MKVACRRQRKARSRAGFGLGPGLALVMTLSFTRTLAGSQPDAKNALRGYNYAQVPSAALARAKTAARRILGAAGVDSVWLDCLEPRGQFPPEDATHAPAPDSHPTVTLRVYNYAHLDSTLLTSAQEVATVIFKGAGMETAWVDCPLSPADFEKYPACEQKTRTTDFALRIMTASMAAKLPTADGPLGFAQHCPDHERGCVANIFYPRVDELASQRGGRAARILGHVMAHEVGHLLLGPNAHSPSGVMRGVWSPDDLKFMNWSYLFFTRRQSAELRARLARRTNLETHPNFEPGSGQL